MRRIAVFLLLAATWLAGPGAAVADEAADAAYRAAVAAARQSPAAADYAKLRALYAASRYIGRGSGKFELRAAEALGKFDKSGKTDKAAIDAFVDENFGDIHAHAIALSTIGGPRGSAPWRLHASAFVGLSRAVMAGGDGRSAAQAYRVFSIS